MSWKEHLQVHQGVVPRYPIEEPDWQDPEPLTELLVQAFEGRVITSVDHDYVKKLLGAE